MKYIVSIRQNTGTTPPPTPRCLNLFDWYMNGTWTTPNSYLSMFKYVVILQECFLEAWWFRGNTFASHRYGLGFDSDSGPHVVCFSPFTANAWFFFLPASEGLKIVPIGTVS